MLCNYIKQRAVLPPLFAKSVPHMEKAWNREELTVEDMHSDLQLFKTVRQRT